MTLRSLRARPLSTGLLIFAVYLLVFVVPGVVATLWPSLAAPGGAGAGASPWTAALDQLPLQLGLAAGLGGVVAALGWGRAVGWTRSAPGGLKYVLIPLLLVAGVFALLIAALAGTGHGAWAAVTLGGGLALVVVNLLTGFTEELMFRGILFHALRGWLGPLLTVAVTALLFGGMHLINLFQGAAVQATTVQVLQAAALGFMLGALRLRIGSVLPLMLYHGVWDLLLDTLGLLGSAPAGSAAAPSAAAAPALSAGVWLPVVLPVLYGAFVLWRGGPAVRAGATVSGG